MIASGLLNSLRCCALRLEGKSHVGDGRQWFCGYHGHLIFDRTACYGISAHVPKDASMGFDLVEIGCVIRLLDVVYNGF